MKPKALIILLFFGMLLPLWASATPVTDATSGPCGDQVTWRFNQSSGTLTISGTGPMYDYAMEYSDGTQNGTGRSSAPWWPHRANIRRVVVEEGVTRVGSCAFFGNVYDAGGLYENLGSVSIAGTVTSIGDNAFSCCPSLQSVTLSEGLETIGFWSFASCSRLSHVDIPETVTYIESGAFAWTRMESADIPDGVVYLGYQSFGYNDGEKSGPKPTKGFKIYGSVGSAAEKYAKENGEYFVFSTAESAGTYYDVRATDWFAPSVLYVSGREIMNGVSEDSFGPKIPATRAMLVTVLHRMEGSPTLPSEAQFADVPATQYYAGAVSWAYQSGIVMGYDVSTFGPNDSVTREQMAAIFYRYANYKGRDASVRSTLSDFEDYEQISPYARNPMSWANGIGLITGTDATHLSPKGAANRAQMATILHRWLEEG